MTIAEYIRDDLVARISSGGITDGGRFTYIEVRIPLEIQALQLARPHLVDDDIRKLLYRNRLPETPTDEPLSDDSLHRYIIQKAGNRYLADFFERHSSTSIFSKRIRERASSGN